MTLIEQSILEEKKNTNHNLATTRKTVHMSESKLHDPSNTGITEGWLCSIPTLIGDFDHVIIVRVLPRRR